jgi:hypothetical protein
MHLSEARSCRLMEENADMPSAGQVEPTGPAFGRPDDKLRETHHVSAPGLLMGFAYALPILRFHVIHLS